MFFNISPFFVIAHLLLYGVSAWGGTTKGWMGRHISLKGRKYAITCKEFTYPYCWPVPLPLPLPFDSRRPTRIAVSIHVGRLESMRRFTSADLNRCVDSRRPTRIAASIRVGCRQSLSIHVGRLESLCRFTSADSNRYNSTP